MILSQYLLDGFRRLRALLAPKREIARLEALAEEAYTAMYDAPRYRVRECHEDAQNYLNQAIRVADRHANAQISERLKQRKKHIYDVYSHQFR